MIIDEHRYWMQKALKQAEIAEQKGEVPVGAVIVKGKQLLAQTHNQVELLKDPTAHAELLAITAACELLQEKYLTGCTLYVTLEPCAMCTGALLWSKIDRIVFAAMDSKAGCCGSRYNLPQTPEFNHSIEVLHGIMEMDAEYLLKSFFQRKR